MATVKQVAAAVGEATGLTATAGILYSRFMREAGLLSQAGHGRAAARATSRDAALLLIVMIVAPRPVDAAAVASDFGGLLLEGGYPEANRMGEWHTLADDLADLFDALGTSEGVDQLWDGRAVVQIKALVGLSIRFVIHDSSPTGPKAEIAIAGKPTSTYWAPARGLIGDLSRPLGAAPPPPQAGDFAELAKKYTRPVISTKAVGWSVLAPIAMSVNGMDPRSILAELSASRGNGAAGDVSGDD